MLAGLAALAASVGLLVGAGVFSDDDSALPAPARIPLVVGLTERRAVSALEAERLRVSIERRRTPGAFSGRVIGQRYGGAKRIGALMMGFEGQIVSLIVAR